MWSSVEKSAAEVKAAKRKSIRAFMLLDLTIPKTPKGSRHAIRIDRSPNWYVRGLSSISSSPDFVCGPLFVRTTSGHHDLNGGLRIVFESFVDERDLVPVVLQINIFCGFNVGSN